MCKMVKTIVRKPEKVSILYLFLSLKALKRVKNGNENV